MGKQENITVNANVNSCSEKGIRIADFADNLTNFNIPRTPQSPKSIRSSPRCSPRCSPRRISSKLPIRTLPSTTKFLLKDLRLPPDDNVINLSEPTSKVTPEKLMEELRVEVKNKNRNRRKAKRVYCSAGLREFGDLDDEISLSVPFVKMQCESELESESERPRMSLRNRSPIVIDAPDLIYEDPLEIARQTLQNTRANSGYRRVKLIYTTERRDGRKEGSNSPEPAFSKKRGITRHFLEIEPDSDFEKSRTEEATILKFNRVLKLFEVEDDDDLEIKTEDIFKLDAPPLKPILKEPKEREKELNLNSSSNSSNNVKIVHVKRVCYANEDTPSTTRNNRTRRKLGNNGAAKRFKKDD